MDANHVWISEKSRGPIPCETHTRGQLELCDIWLRDYSGTCSPSLWPIAQWTGLIWGIWGSCLGMEVGGIGGNHCSWRDQNRVLAVVCSPESGVGPPLWEFWKCLWFDTTVFGLIELCFSRKPHFSVKRGVCSTAGCQVHEGRHFSTLPNGVGLMPWAAGTGGRHSKYLLNKRKGKCLPCKLPGNISEVDKRPLIHILPQINHFSSQKTKNYLTFSLPSHIILFLLFSHSVMSNSLWPHELQHARLPCPSPTPGVCSNSCPLIQWCHPTISSSVVPFSSYPQSFPASGSFPMSWLFASGGQSIGASASVLPMNIQGWFPLGLTGFMSLLSQELSRVFSNTTVWNNSTKSILSIDDN